MVLRLFHRRLSATRSPVPGFGIVTPVSRRGGHVGVDPELLEILACPSCKTPVVLVHEETGLKCKQCHRVYPIKDDIPVMLIDEATIEP
jgi:uncharacterized protein YbaR (Trm112 family)